MMATQFSHNSFLYFKYIIRKGNGTFVSSAYLKLQSFFILIPGSPKLPGPPKTFSFILYTYHSQNQRAKRTAKPFRPLILFFILFSFLITHLLSLTIIFILIHPCNPIQENIICLWCTTPIGLIFFFYPSSNKCCWSQIIHKTICHSFGNC